MLRAELPYPQDGDLATVFAPLAPLPWSIWLDSGTEPQMAGRYDIMVAEPQTTLITRDGVTTITNRDGAVRKVQSDPFTLLRQLLGPQQQSETELPFAGGAMGYFGYDLARLLTRLPNLAEEDLSLPQMAVGVYHWAIVCDRHERRCWIVSNRFADEHAAEWRRLLQRFASPPRAATQPPAALTATAPLRSNMSRRDYQHAFSRVQHYLGQGDCYQVNLAQRFAVRVEGSPWAGYLQLRRRSAGPFSAYLNLPDLQILSTSPERFLRKQRSWVQTRPIKGTRRRSETPAQDRALARELAGSTKDRAENVMIVDLLRNDLGRSCRPGSIEVTELFHVESFATVHHLVSTVEGHLAEGEDALSLLRAAFPGGSITGAPKQRAMEIIEQLEPQRRGVYCGSIGFIGFDGGMDTNIAIRTAIHTDGRLYYSAGGGIVADSDSEQEYQETFDKAAAFFACFSDQ
ncbi:MAG: aminodeoxychorismate synthase component I [Pseudomonadota bacterium]